MDKQELRKKDFVTSIILLGFSLWLILYTLLAIPMKDSWGGVMNVWYVSPGLFPLFVGLLLILMALVLGVNAVREGGAGKFLADLSRRGKALSEKNLRLLGILLVIAAYVYLNIPRVDFFLSTVVCLAVFISFFYFDKGGLLKKLFRFYLAGSALFLALFLSGADEKLTSSFSYSRDVLVLLFLFAYLFYCGALIRGDRLLQKKWRITLVMSLIPSLVLIPVFKFFLLVPLPVEGLFVELMTLVRYSLR
jgi:hypothetical protein